MRPLLLVLALFGFCAQDKGTRKLEWKLAPGHAAEFAYLDKAGKPLADQKLVVFASELTPSSNRIAIDTWEQIPVALVFQLPPEPIKGASGWEFDRFFFNEWSESYDYSTNGSFKPVCARGRYILKIQKKGDDEIATIEGSIVLNEVRRDLVNSAVKVTVTKIELGTLATSAQYSLSKGMLLKAAWQYRAKAQDREVARIVEWLKKQQKNGAWTSAVKGGPPGNDAVSLTSVVVRALAAAGVKPDDPAILAASKTLRSTPPQENFTLCQQILALAAKSPTKEEADDLRRFVEEIQKRREARTGGWAPVPGKNEYSTAFLTALALEALAAAPDARVSDETFK